MAGKKDSADGKQSRTDRVLTALARRMFPPDTQGKSVDNELRDIADGEQGGGRR